MSSERTKQLGTTTQARGMQAIKKDLAGKAGDAAKKPTTPTPPTSYKNQAITVQVSSGDEKEFAAAVARKLTRPEVSAAGVIETWQKDTHDVNELVSELTRQIDAVNSGDLARAEGMLIAQPAPRTSKRQAAHAAAVVHLVPRDRHGPGALVLLTGRHLRCRGLARLALRCCRASRPGKG